MSADESSTHVDECRQVQTIVDESLEKCRQIKTIVDESKIFYLIPEKVTHGSNLLFLQLRKSRPYRYGNFQFCSLICEIDPRNVLTPYIKKTHFSIISLNARELELN